jgi:DNA-binding LacI/PurR family transcriptional regulator
MQKRFAWGNVLGYIVWPHIPVNRCRQILQALAASGKPVAVLDELEAWDIAAIVPSAPRTRIFGITRNEKAGLEVGAFLLAMGHRRVCYLSVESAAAWSRERLAGLRKAYAHLDCLQSVATFVAEPATDWFAFSEKTQHDPAFRKLLADEERLRLMRKGLPQARPDDVKTGLLLTLWHEQRTALLEGLMEQALRLRNVTAWVTENDDAGLYACDYLANRKGMTLGRDISVMGFDDRIESFGQRLSSYNFNITALATAAVQFVLRNGTHPAHRGGNVVTIPGFIVQRPSVGPGTVR